MIIATNHALERARERLGYEGDRDTLAAIVGGSRGARVGLEMQAPHWRIRMHSEGMTAVMRYNVIATVLRLKK